ncbi:hypothetical protein Fmac_005617 [Flemingia macrophylla]|uniref:Transmembrane protein n=1 Tax=Flemingia macrophylla TaxID=520843 RepID=A0ABD1N8A2_9FABA
MSLQAQPQQPVQVYPTNQPPSSISHHSNGSFGAVFIVLAIILVISVVACFLGRLCNRRYNSHSTSQRIPKQHRQQIHNLHPRDNQGDIELGFDDKRMPPPIIMPKGHGQGHAHHGHGHGTGPQMHVNDNIKDFEMKHGHGEEV